MCMCVHTYTHTLTTPHPTPSYRYEGDPMRLLFSKSASPHHGFAAYYTYLEKVRSCSVSYVCREMYYIYT